MRSCCDVACGTLKQSSWFSGRATTRVSVLLARVVHTRVDNCVGVLEEQLGFHASWKHVSRPCEAPRLVSLYIVFIMGPTVGHNMSA